jgi:hypothetical protein
MSAYTSDGQVLVERRGDATFAVDATLAYIVVLATLGDFGEPPERVMSGINHGANTGRGIIIAHWARPTGRTALAIPDLDHVDHIGRRPRAGASR